jgi:hypothetical protein
MNGSAPSLTFGTRCDIIPGVFLTYTVMKQLLVFTFIAGASEAMVQDVPCVPERAAMVDTGVRAIGSFSKAKSFQFSRCGYVPPERTIDTRASRGARSRLFSRYISQSLKRIVRSGRVVAWAPANEPSNVRQLCRRKLACDLFDTSLVEQRDGRYDRFGYAFCLHSLRRCLFSRTTVVDVVSIYRCRKIRPDRIDLAIRWYGSPFWHFLGLGR